MLFAVKLIVITPGNLIASDERKLLLRRRCLVRGNKTQTATQIFFNNILIGCGYIKKLNWSAWPCKKAQVQRQSLGPKRFTKIGLVHQQRTFRPLPEHRRNWFWLTTLFQPTRKCMPKNLGLFLSKVKFETHKKINTSWGWAVPRARQVRLI